jgi:hypothetical protein
MLAGIALALAALVPSPMIDPNVRYVLAGSFAIGGWIGAWTWWSWSVPRWRLWALRVVDDWPRLKEAAVKTLLTWPDGSPFEKTEIKSERQREAEQVLRRKREGR